jgi:putative transposase
MSRRQGWRGHQWQERFHSILMDEGYLLATVRYVERNPVTARLCRHPGEWPWSSARTHLQGIDDSLVIVKPMLERIPDWNAYLSRANESDRTESIRRHNRTGRPRQCRIHPGPRATNRKNPDTQTPWPQTIFNQLGILSPELP